MLNQISHIKNDKYCDFTYGNLKRAEQINKTTQKQVHRHRGEADDCQRGPGLRNGNENDGRTKKLKTDKI